MTHAIVAYTFDGSFYCPLCIGDVVQTHRNALIAPVFNTDEVQDYPVCDECGDLITNITLVYTETEETYVHTLFYAEEAEAQWASARVEECLQAVNDITLLSDATSWVVVIACGCKADDYDKSTAVLTLHPLSATFNKELSA